MNEVAFDTVGPVLIADATNDRIADAIGKNGSFSCMFFTPCYA